MSVDLSDKIERMEQIEEKLGVVLQGLSAFTEDREYIRVCGEISLRAGTRIKDMILVTIAVYDTKGRVRASTDVFVNESDAFGLQTFEESLNGFDTNDISKIKVFCKK